MPKSRDAPAMIKCVVSKGAATRVLLSSIFGSVTNLASVGGDDAIGEGDECDAHDADADADYHHNRLHLHVGGGGDDDYSGDGDEGAGDVVMLRVVVTRSLVMMGVVVMMVGW